MSEPLGRDRLGRLVYEGDFLDIGDGFRWKVARPNCKLERMFDEKAIVLYPVDLAASPSRTNYERYFADLGTIDQIIVAYMDDVLQSDDLFWVDFQHELWWDYGYAGFEAWLKQEATV